MTIRIIENQFAPIPLLLLADRLTNQWFPDPAQRDPAFNYVAYRAIGFALLGPLSVLLVFLIGALFWWSVRSLALALPKLMALPPPAWIWRMTKKKKKPIIK